MKEAIWQRVLKLLPPGAVSNRQKVMQESELGLGPLEFIEMLLEIERRFNIRFSDAELQELRQAQRLLSSVEGHLRKPLYAEFFALLLQNGSWL